MNQHANVASSMPAGISPEESRRHLKNTFLDIAWNDRMAAREE
jgi:hypothetical protein